MEELVLCRETFGKIIRKHFKITDNLSKEFYGGPKNIYNGIFIREPKLRVFRPTIKEMESFSDYIKKIERIVDTNMCGVVKIIPPPEFKCRKSGYDKLSFDIVAKQQQISGKNSAYVVTEESNGSKKLNFLKYYALATSEKYFPECIRELDNEKRENYFWENFRQLDDKTANPFIKKIKFNKKTKRNEEITVYKKPTVANIGLYAAGLNISLMDEDPQVLNIMKLDNLFNRYNEHAKTKKSQSQIHFPDVTNSYMYIGMWNTVFPWHTEDNNLYSMSYLNSGESKIWYVIPPAFGTMFDDLVNILYKTDDENWPALLRQKYIYLDPRILRSHGIPCIKVEHKVNEFLVLFPHAYHMGFNTGFNIAEAKNFATKNWVSYGKKAKKCQCEAEGKVDIPVS
jgi:jumonji domain-containing protein 2